MLPLVTMYFIISHIPNNDQGSSPLPLPLSDGTNLITFIPPVAKSSTNSKRTTREEYFSAV